MGRGGEEGARTKSIATSLPVPSLSGVRAGTTRLDLTVVEERQAGLLLNDVWKTMRAPVNVLKLVLSTGQNGIVTTFESKAGSGLDVWRREGGRN